MSDLPDEFTCTVTTWEYIYRRCRDVADQVRDDEFEPDVVVALARGGWFAGRCICDFVGLDDLTSLKVEHYVGTGETDEEVTIRYPLSDGAVDGKDVLVIDDIADTGGSMERAVSHVEDRDPGEVRTATLQLLSNSGFAPDYVGEYVEEWQWLVYPWNFVEDMVELLAGVMEKADAGPYALDDLRHLLEAYHDIGQVELEIAQPDRMGEVVAEMERRGLVEGAGDGRYRLAD